MNTIVTTALALAAVGGEAFAAPNGDSEWLELDREIGRLAPGYATRDSAGADYGVLLRAYYGRSTSGIFDGSNDTDNSGFQFGDMDLWFQGEVGDFAYRLSADLDSGSATVEDAWMRWGPNEHLRATLGNYKAPVMRSANVNPENTFFGERTRIGASFDRWDAGFGLNGVAGPFSWYFNLMNGLTNELSKHFWNLRFEIDIGSGAGSYEGAYGSGDGFDATVGLAIMNDDTQPRVQTGTNSYDDDSMAYGLDFAGSVGPIGFAAEIMKRGDNFSTSGTPDILFVPMQSGHSFGLRADETPWNAMVTVAASDQVEFGFRYQKLDNMIDSKLTSIGVNYYTSGHNAKLSASYTRMRNSKGADDGGYFMVGLTVGSSN